MFFNLHTQCSFAARQLFVPIVSWHQLFLCVTASPDDAQPGALYVIRKPPQRSSHELFHYYFLTLRLVCRTTLAIRLIPPTLY